MKNCSWPWFSSSQTGMYLKCSGIKKHSIIWHTFELWCMCVCQSLSCVWLFTTPWTVVRQAPLSMEFSRQQYWSGLLFPAPGDLPDPVIKPRSPALQADSLPSEPPGKPLLMLRRPLKEEITCFGDFLNTLRTQRKWMKKFQTPFSALPLKQF